MYGWRGRIGLIAPSSNTTIESEVARLIPDGVSLHASRFPIVNADPDDYRASEAENAMERGADLVADAGADVVIYGSTGGSFLEGKGYEEEVESRLRDAAGVPGIAVGASIKRAFDALGLHSLAVLTPYPEWFNVQEEAYLEDSGYEVVYFDGLEIELNTDIGAEFATRPYQQAREIDADDYDGLFISCTNYRTIEAIPALEADLGVPVVTSNQAAAWDALCAIGVDTAGIEAGRLFGTPPA